MVGLWLLLCVHVSVYEREREKEPRQNEQMHTPLQMNIYFVYIRRYLHIVMNDIRMALAQILSVQENEIMAKQKSNSEQTKCQPCNWFYFLRWYSLVLFFCRSHFFHKKNLKKNWNATGIKQIFKRKKKSTLKTKSKPERK